MKKVTKLSELPTKSFCILPWVSTTISPDGNVVPCCLWNGRPERMFAYEHNLKMPDVSDGLENARHSEFYQKIRQMMIDGERPSGCNVCYKNEDSVEWKNHEKAYDRIHQRITQHNRYADKDVTVYKNEPLPLNFLETGISSLCNFACVMCDQTSSSIIYGVYNKGVSIPRGFAKSIDNIDADLSSLTLVKILGGEPMIEKKHDNLLKKIIEQNKNVDKLCLEYHTNVSVFPSQRVIDQWKRLKSVNIIFSIDSVGKDVKMQRPGKYEWKDIENTVDKYIQLQSEGVPLIFSANLVLTAINIGTITETCDWLYEKLKNTKTGYFNMNRLYISESMKYIDYRNLSKETKQRIKDKWKKWEDSKPPVLQNGYHEFSDDFPQIARLYATAKTSIDEEGTLNEPLTKELMLEKHPLRKLWKEFKQNLSGLDI